MSLVALVSWFPDTLLVKQMNGVSYLVSDHIGDEPSLDSYGYWTSAQLNPMLAIWVGTDLLGNEVR